jgi:branched-chain amino acid transport system ATP-binding protein
MNRLDQNAAQPATQAAVMTLAGVSRRFGALNALDDMSFDIRGGEILGIAGPNGAGKTTLLNVCTGVLPVSSGSIEFGGQSIANSTPHRCCHLGIARTFQIPQVFSSMSVEDNVATGAVFGVQGHGSATVQRGHVNDVLEMVGLSAQRRQSASEVDLLTRKRIMLGAALATRPKIIFLDEPLSGLNAEEVDVFVALFRRLHAALNLTLVIVEHKVKALAAVSQRILILNFGTLLCLDTPAAVLRDPQVIDIYLGSQNFA